VDDISALQGLFLITLLIILGGTAGFMAGLTGIGGGIVLVPGLYYIFTSLGFSSDGLMHLAVGTSLAFIVPTGCASARAHWKRGSIQTDLAVKIGVGVLLGAVIGPSLANYISGESLKMVFAIALLILSVFMFLEPVKISFRLNLIHTFWPSVYGVFSGTLSSLIGIGGATINVPFMVMNGLSIHKAVGTAASLGPVITFPAALGFVIIGWNQSGLPLFSFGYVNIAALILLVPVSMWMTSFGVAAAHKFSVTTLRRIFCGFMIAGGIAMLAEVLNG